jgi:hypothetical protein
MELQGIADDYYININLQTALALPTGRETVLHFCEAVQKQFPSMSSFFQRETGEFVLEADREAGSYQWMELQDRRLMAGYFNPPTVAEAYRLHSWLLDRSRFFLGLGGLDVEALDVLYGFNLDCRSNRDAVVSQALLDGSPLAAMLGEAGTPIEFEPNLVVALDEGCHTQCRLNLETRGNSFQVRSGDYDDEPISVYLTVRQYPQPGQLISLAEAFKSQCRTGEDLICRSLLPHIIQPLAATIAAQ